MIRPALPTTGTTHAADSAIEYDLVASAPLPCVNCSLSIKRVLFNNVWLARYNWFQRTTKHAVSFAFAMGIGLACSFPFLNREVGVWVSAASTALMVIPVACSFLILRFDMLKLLLRTYEFWFLTSISLVTEALVCICLNDARISLIVCLVFMYQHVFLIDANSRHASVVIIAGTVGVIFIAAFIVLQGFQLVKDYSSIAMAQYGEWSLSASDVVTNGLSTIVIVIIRNAYRKRRAISHLSRDSATVRCVTYRARLKFMLVERGESHHPTTPETTIESRVPIASPALSQLRLAPPIRRVQATDFVQSFISLRRTSHRFIKAAWTAVGVCGLVMTSMSVVMPSLGVPAAALALFLTNAYCLRCVMLHNRKLVRMMLSSYDFLFLALQSYVGHFVLAYMLEWDVRWSLILLCSVCWSHWAYTLDAMTPLVRHRLGLSLRLASAVLVFETIAHLLLYDDMLNRRQLVTQDKVLFNMSMFGASNRRLFGVPFLLNRMFTTLFWCLRLLWRLHTRSENELLLLQGAVEYDDYDSMRRLRGANRRDHRPHRAKLELGAPTTSSTTSPGR